METQPLTNMTVETRVKAPVEKVWECWTSPSHITQWNQASDDWHSPRAENDLRPGGKFMTRMEAKTGDMGFDFEGIYDEVIPHELISYTMGDGRKVNVRFKASGEETIVIESFDAETTHSPEMQQAGWQAILDSFRMYTERIVK